MVLHAVNIAGRFDMQRGIKERFGEDIMAKLASENQIPMSSKRDDGTDINWVLTKWSLRDRLSLDMQAVCLILACPTCNGLNTQQPYATFTTGWFQVSSRILCTEVCTGECVDRSCTHSHPPGYAVNVCNHVQFMEQRTR